MMPKLLIVPSASVDRDYVNKAIAAGVDVRMLDCFDATHHSVESWLPGRTLQVPAHRMSVQAAVESEGFEIAVVHDQADDFVRTALLTRTLRDAQVRHVLVVCTDSSRCSLYRRCGAHQVIRLDAQTDLWSHLESCLSMNITAS